MLFYKLSYALCYILCFLCLFFVVSSVCLSIVCLVCLSRVCYSTNHHQFLYILSMMFVIVLNVCLHKQIGFADFLKCCCRIFFLLSPFFNVNFGFEATKLPLKYNDLLIFLTLLQDLTSISQMIPKTKQNIDYKYTKMSIEFFSSLNSEDNLILSPRLLFVTENEVKIWSFF